jgi:hypothetical protein
MKNKSFQHRLIQGKIVEHIFELMLREAGCFTVLAFGYENTLPELMQRHADMKKAAQTMEIIRRAPDFVVINNDNHEVHLIEVKYRSHARPKEVASLAAQMLVSWKPAYLFLATPSGFFFGKAADIVRDNGKIMPLVHKKIPPKMQSKYQALLAGFLG